ncbi:MAG: hypothetical protein WAK48_09350 [Candidatus Acidiferrum sp.]
MEKLRTLFYVTSPDAVDSILAEGLRANPEGRIFAITDTFFADRVAKTQLSLCAYAIFAIDTKGITGKIEADNVGELASRWHRFILQDVIRPEFLTLIAREVKTLEWTPADALLFKSFGRGGGFLAFLREEKKKLS